MYLYSTVQVISHVFVFYRSSVQSCICILRSSDQSCICILRFKWEVMYLYTTVQVISHVFVYYGSSDQSCICILPFKCSVMYLYTTFKWSVMYLYTTVQVISHVFVYYGSSDQSCICILQFKWSVMYLYTTVQVISHVFACFVYVYCNMIYFSYKMSFSVSNSWFMKEDKYLIGFDSISQRVCWGNPIYILTMKHIKIDMWSFFLPSIIYLYKFTYFATIWEKGRVSYPRVHVIVKNSKFQWTPIS
jgi:hypothetical protein